VSEGQELTVDPVYVIINEWTDIANATSSEIVDGKFYITLASAAKGLSVIAATYGLQLEEDQTAISLEDHDFHMQSEEYYIQELTNA
jgi:hypothetical protein